MHKNWEAALQHEVWRILICNGYGENIIIHTFVIAEQIHGTLQTRAVGANLHD
jgi:hypothetical protein